MGFAMTGQNKNTLKDESRQKRFSAEAKALFEISCDVKISAKRFKGKSVKRK